MASTANATHTTTNDKVALVFGISGDQGQAVAKGLLSTRSYKHVYGVTRDLTEEHIQSIERHMSASSSMPAPQTQQETNTTTTTAVTFLQVDLNNPSSLRSVFESTRATDIFLVTTTDMPPEEGAMGSFHESEEREYESIVSFFNVLVEVHRKEWYDEHASQEETKKPLERHVIFSTLDNVRGLVEWLESHGETKDVDELLKIKPSDDGGIVPHYSGKGRGAEHALSLIHGIPSPWKEQHPESSRSSSAMNPPWMTTSEPTQSIIDGLSVTLVTLPFLHSNFSASAIPLPTNSKGRTIEWSISACLGDSSHPLDMFSVSDLQYVIPTLFQQRAKYQGRTVRLSAEKLTMDDVAYQFSDLFGKDVIYSPLTVEEMSSLEGIPGVPAWAQMCQYLASAYASHDVEETERIMEVCGKKPQKFQDWLLTHSDDAGFEKVGLSLDGEHDALYSIGPYIYSLCT